MTRSVELKLLVVTGIFLFLSACTTTQADRESSNPLLIAKRLSSASLKCPESKLTTTYAGKGHGESVDRVLAQGCGKSEAYICYDVSFTLFKKTYTCRSENSVKPPQSVVEGFVLGQAVIDLNCKRNNLRLTRVAGGREFPWPNAGTYYDPDGSEFVVKGCKKQARYLCEDVAPWYSPAKFKCNKFK